MAPSARVSSKISVSKINVTQKIKTSPLSTLQKTLGYTFKDKALLDRALTHRSLQSTGVHHDYERLEFLGDAVLDLAVAHLLLDTYPDIKEGELSKMRAALVNTQSLADIARNLKLGKYVRLSRGELATGGNDRPSILADVVEALFGAIYREAGYDIAKDIITSLFGDRIVAVKPTDPKTELQEIMHAVQGSQPIYKLLETRGPEHAPIFVSIVEINNQIEGEGEGSTKKASQQAAAAQALAKLKAQQNAKKEK